MCIKQACNLEESGTCDSKHKKNQLSEPEHKNDRNKRFNIL